MISNKCPIQINGQGAFREVNWYNLPAQNARIAAVQLELGHMHLLMSNYELFNSNNFSIR